MFTRFQPKEPTNMRLFAFANAGGSAANFRGWADQLPVEVYAIDLPGQGKRLREKPVIDVIELVDTLAHDLLPLLDQPFVLFGYSMGALVSFELVRALRRVHGLSPQHLFVAARRAPHSQDPRPPLHKLDEPAFIKEVQRRYNGIPAVVQQEPELLALFLPILRANFALLETYVYRDDEALCCPITAFGGLQDPTTSAAELSAWGELTQGTFDRHLFAGDHFFVQQQQHALLAALSKRLN